MNKNIGLHSIPVFLLPALRTVLFIAAGILLVILPPFKGKSLMEVSRKKDTHLIKKEECLSYFFTNI